ncbi:hypothetical protein BKI52_44385 [marine bacterium AO1-C]|nr:hypothetical protein BKI52_44385 [marine bacterium AO1-C]
MDFIQKNRTVVSHLGFWLGYYLLMVLALLSYEKSIGTLQFLRILLFVNVQVILAYANMYFFVPIFFFRRRYLLYVVLIVSFGILLSEAHIYIIDNFLPSIKPERIPRQEIRNAIRGIFLLLVTALSTAHRVLKVSQDNEREVNLLKRQQLEQEQEASALKSENLETELKFLKSQINPHFLFNALNNIYTLTYIEDDEAPDMILKLSDMLRYILYDCTSREVPIEKEINYLENYVELQRLKMDDLTLQMEIGTFDPQVSIAPMLFIPFIENSFKHSKIEDTKNGWIKLKLWAEEDQIHFHLSNSKPQKKFTKDKVGGIGLQNVKRRLELLYAEKHTLTIQDTPQSFEVDLSLHIH